MQTITLEPLRWQEAPSRITVHADNSHPAVFYQVLTPSSAEAVCCGRPVEELPRILPMLAPSHHLTAAQALDRLFQVDPPELAQNMRTALLQAQYCSAHLRKLFFLLTSRQAPFADFRTVSRGYDRSPITQRLLEKVMHHLALAQEAEDILGGRHDHPLTAVAGGVSRYLKEGHYERLADIGQTLVSFTRDLASILRDEIIAEEGLLAPWSNLVLPVLDGLYLAPGGQPTLVDSRGVASQPFGAERIGERIALQKEAWTYQPFAYFKEKGWQSLGSPEGCFYVGPLARFNANQAAATPLAEQTRQQMIECLGTPPVYKLTAAFAAMAVELIQAAETLQDLCSVEKLSGPALRTIPTGHGDASWSALEAPQGLTWHQYQVDDAGTVQNVTVIDARAANNALKCMLAQQMVSEALARKDDPAQINVSVSVALLPF